MGIHLSIIIPMYNVEEYIERCILSIVEQPVYPERNYELIVINDGSTDRSSNIIKELQKTYPFIQLINQENGGLSAARNTGLDHAKGEFIFFIDADDYIEPDTLHPLLNTITKQNPDIILFGVSKTYQDKRKKALKSHLPTSAPLQSIKVDEYINDYTILSAAWQGLFKRRLIERHNIRMPKGRFAEDDDFCIKFFSVAESLYYIPLQVYNYYQRSGSISNNDDTPHNNKVISDRIEIFKQLNIYIQTFTGNRRYGLERKLDFLALDIIRLLIRYSCSKETIKDSLNELKLQGFYPLRKKKYNTKYNFFKNLFDNPLKIQLIVFSKILNRFF